VGVEDVYANDSAPTVLEGDSHDNTLVSSRGADHIYGWGGNDVLDGQAGDNTNDGGLGHDICLNPDGEAGAASCEN
jgi:Ca2+-binding RTX toxin-like protein